MNRVTGHPVLPPARGREVSFTFRGAEYRGREGEPVTSALIAAGVHVFGEHPKDSAPQGLFCANGQCSQCTVLVNGLPVKGCMTPLSEGMRIEPCAGRPALPEAGGFPSDCREVKTLEVPFLIIGGGPAGLSAAAELGRRGLRGVLVDDKGELGGKLCLQTHKFFGSREACHAGVRGIDIAGILTKEIEDTGCVDVWTNSPALGVFPDKTVGVLKDGQQYVLLRPRALLMAAGARERSLVFPGCDLPGVMGAGAFQTLVNRDGVLPGRRLFIIGGGNVGLIVAYHALQAGMEVAGLAEYLPECGGYLVHEDKIRRLGVPMYTGHTILGAEGTDHLTAVTIAALDGTEKRFEVDTLLVAVGLSPVDELYRTAEGYGMKVFAAGDAEDISEASAAMLGGRIAGGRIAAADTGGDGSLAETLEVLKSRPGARPAAAPPPQAMGRVYPVIRCFQEIPCNPCTEVCPVNAIIIDGGGLLGLPVFRGDECIGCGKCVLSCPGLAITLVDERAGGAAARVTLPWEMPLRGVEAGKTVRTVDRTGEPIGVGMIVTVTRGKDHCRLVTVEVPREEARNVASIVPLSPLDAPVPGPGTRPEAADEAIVCRCERVTRGEIVALIRQGYRDMNSFKAALRTGMGACGGKTCENLIKQIFLEEGIAPEEITGFTKRPPLQEAPLGRYAGMTGDGGRDAG